MNYSPVLIVFEVDDNAEVHIIEGQALKFNNQIQIVTYSEILRSLENWKHTLWFEKILFKFRHNITNSRTKCEKCVDVNRHLLEENKKWRKTISRFWRKMDPPTIMGMYRKYQFKQLMLTYQCFKLLRLLILNNKKNLKLFDGFDKSLSSRDFVKIYNSNAHNFFFYNGASSFLYSYKKKYLKENLVLNFLTLDIRINIFINFKLQNYVDNFVKIRTYKKSCINFSSFFGHPNFFLSTFQKKKKKVLKKNPKLQLSININAGLIFTFDLYYNAPIVFNLPSETNPEISSFNRRSVTRMDNRQPIKLK
ncbi:hypothetical protein AGLY_000291 [Aphis glycines]|uniref:Uncharacterized protein n=1 Tax=Aphis glycines TaxID=307491 RepID=A0A6G0U818_APHGL|nr:hypothetical protein AGLY_000291 [Aphis glycines]